MGLLERSPSPPTQIKRNPSPTKPKAEIKHEHRKLKRERTDSESLTIPKRKKVRKTALPFEDIETVDLTADD